MVALFVREGWGGAKNRGGVEQNYGIHVYVTEYKNNIRLLYFLLTYLKAISTKLKNAWKSPSINDL